VTNRGHATSGQEPVSASFDREARALASSGAFVDFSSETRLEFRGKDILDLLNRLSTNHLLGLLPGRSAGTVLTSDRGRIIAVLEVALQAPHQALLLTGAPAPAVMQWIDRYTFEEDAALRDVRAETCEYAVAGPESRGIVRAVAGDQAASLGHGEHRSAAVAGASCLLARLDVAGVPCWRLIAPVGHAESLANALAAVAPAASRETFGAYLIGLGVPTHGAELNDSSNPLEANLRPLVSFTKGCYIGQEVIARLDTYDKVQRVLVRIASRSPLTSGELVSAGGEDAGRVTSSAYWPPVGEYCALAYVSQKLISAGASWSVNGAPVSVRLLAPAPDRS
jgi:folate-binding protein YgfZ